MTVETDRKTFLTHCLDQLVSLNADESVTVVSYQKEQIIDWYERAVLI